MIPAAPVAPSVARRFVACRSARRRCARQGSDVDHRVAEPQERHVAQKVGPVPPENAVGHPHGPGVVATAYCAELPTKTMVFVPPPPSIVSPSLFTVIVSSPGPLTSLSILVKAIARLFVRPAQLEKVPGSRLMMGESLKPDKSSVLFEPASQSVTTGLVSIVKSKYGLIEPVMLQLKPAFRAAGLAEG